jgi:hypothetical protein
MSVEITSNLLSVEISATTNEVLITNAGAPTVTVSTIGAQGPAGEAEIESGTVVDGGTFN